MKRKLFLCICFFLYCFTFSQELSPKWIVSQDESAIWRLYKTDNMWVYLQLNTMNGTICLLQYSLEELGGIYGIINFQDLVKDNNYFPGRFTLYPTENMFNYILLDQFNGNSWQVQWSFEPENCLIVPLGVLDSGDSDFESD